MRNFAKIGLQITIVTYAILHFFTSFFEINILINSLAIIGLCMFFLSIFYLSINQCKLPSFIFILGVLVLLYADSPLLDGILHGTLQMRNMIGLLIIVPLISWVLREEPYIEDIMSLFYRWINTSRRFYFGLLAFTQIIAYFLLFGSITMMYQFAHIILKNHQTEAWENFKGTALLRGFGLSTLWVVSIPSFVFAVETLGASLWIAIMQGFCIAMVGTWMAVIFSYFQEKKYGVEITPVLQTELTNVLSYASSKEVQVKKVIEFFLLFLTLFGSIFVIHAIFPLPLMLLIPIVIIAWVCLFYFVKGKGRKLFFVFRDYVKRDMTNQAYQLNVMVTVGVLIYGLKHTEFANAVVGGLNYIQDHFPLINSLYLLPFLVVLLGFLGLGPLTVMVLVAGILQSMALPYPPELIVLAVTSGSVISILISPVIMPVIVLSASNGLNLFTNGFRFNWKYAIAFYILVQAYIQTMIHFW
ncbi:hypothetical protein ACFSKI_22510 [Pseudogracilibacillus auburnensis]|uniref:Uncharacterized protein n=1 Tax=Pseudogracilibacillus auburnensis TaxID=1494959 RepID=A0A2V3VUP6_9BACI|nr:hypothetical protein [Pseudogracilibacillus auburnensis]PXW85376.1 hypothetical protein DFR56_111144 [Pseudogracilibacillus auburnensis]